MDIQRIVVTGRLFQEMEPLISGVLSKQIQFLPEEEVSRNVLAWADAFVAFKPVSNFDFYNIKWVHCLGAGVDGFLYNREWKKDVLLTRTNAAFGDKISEYCISYMLAHLQQHEAFKINQALHQWRRIEPIPFCKKKVVLFGTGVIAQEVARKLGCFHVVPDGISLSGQARPGFNRIVKLEQAAELLKDADWVINTLPLTAGTKNLLNQSIFSKMKGACFINVGRGATVEEQAMINALEAGNLQLAVLDVFPEEPLPEDSKLWAIPGIQITPHIAAVTSPEEAAVEFLSTLSAIENNRFPLSNQVDYLQGY